MTDSIDESVNKDSVPKPIWLKPLKVVFAIFMCILGVIILAPILSNISATNIDGMLRISKSLWIFRVFSYLVLIYFWPNIVIYFKPAFTKSDNAKLRWLLVRIVIAYEIFLILPKLIS